MKTNNTTNRITLSLSETEASLVLAAIRRHACLNANKANRFEEKGNFEESKKYMERTHVLDDLDDMLYTKLKKHRENKTTYTFPIIEELSNV